MQGLLPGSVSKYCLQSSPIPVIVVRPSSKRMKKKRKRMADPNRRTYNTILEQSYGGNVLDRRNSSVLGPLPSATDDEAAAVAKAIGVPTNFRKQKYGGHLSRVTSGKSEVLDDAESPPSQGYFPAGYMRTLRPDTVATALKSPTLAALDWESDDDTEDENQKPTEEGKSNDKLGTGEEGAETNTSKPHKPSFSEDPPWLKAILSRPETPRERRRSSAAARRLSLGHY